MPRPATLSGQKPRLTEAAVRLIRREYNEAIRAGRRPKLRPFCERYNMCHSALSQLCARTTYKWVTS
jgi:hypothetical protein